MDSAPNCRCFIEGQGGGSGTQTQAPTQAPATSAPSGGTGTQAPSGGSGTHTSTGGHETVTSGASCGSKVSYWSMYRKVGNRSIGETFRRTVYYKNYSAK